MVQKTFFFSTTFFAINIQNGKVKEPNSEAGNLIGKKMAIILKQKTI